MSQLFEQLSRKRLAEYDPVDVPEQLNCKVTFVSPILMLYGLNDHCRIS